MAVMCLLLLLLMVRGCALHCVKERLSDAEFSINFSSPVNVESGQCISIPYEFTFPTYKVTVPYKKVWFRGDPQNAETSTLVQNMGSGTRDTLSIDGLPQGRHEYGFKLEWDCNQTYIFPKRVHISVYEFNSKPTMVVPLLTEGQVARLHCDAPQLCHHSPDISWTWTKADGSTEYLSDSYQSNQNIQLTPTAAHNNTIITCAAKYKYNTITRSVRLALKFAPKILDTSRCTTDGKLLICECISVGNPPAPIIWPLSALTDFSVSSSGSFQTVVSTLTVPEGRYHYSSVNCSSRNDVGQATRDILIRASEPRRTYKFSTVHIWMIAAGSIILNLVLLGLLISSTFKCFASRSSSTELQPGGHKEIGEEMDTYAALDPGETYGELYSSITPGTG